jgi:hypothetical protein
VVTAAQRDAREAEPGVGIIGGQREHAPERGFGLVERSAAR